VTRITVVIPAHNAEAYIAEAIASVCTQTISDVEIVLVDDGSTDETVATASRFSDKCPMTILRVANSGPAAARNLGIRHARGQYCAFLDADDKMLPNRLETQATLLDGEPEVGLVHSDLMTFNERGIIHRSRRAFSDPCGGRVLDRLLLDNCITTSTVMSPTGRLLEVGMFKEERRVSEDFDLWLRMAVRWRVAYIEEPLTLYRRRQGSLSDDKLSSGLSALEVIEAFWREHEQYRRERPQLYRRSLGRHFAATGAAALGQGRRGVALRYLVSSLRYEPLNDKSWRWLAKSVLPRAAWNSKGADNPGAFD
jgi:glycosyltransferase involved in cell wall biosynthesis